MKTNNREINSDCSSFWSSPSPSFQLTAYQPAQLHGQQLYLLVKVAAIRVSNVVRVQDWTSVIVWIYCSAGYWDPGVGIVGGPIRVVVVVVIVVGVPRTIVVVAIIVVRRLEHVSCCPRHLLAVRHLGSGSCTTNSQTTTGGNNDFVQLLKETERGKQSHTAYYYYSFREIHIRLCIQWGNIRIYWGLSQVDERKGIEWIEVARHCAVCNSMMEITNRTATKIKCISRTPTCTASREMLFQTT